jgi:hypothetical protein
MDISPKCAVCIRDYEDGVHHFFKCKPVNKIWRAWDLVQMEEVMINLATNARPLKRQNEDARKAARCLCYCYLVVDLVV